ncbi:unnamed protein product, partial [Prunus brigantina]
MRLHRVEPSPPARHDKKSRQLGNRYVVGSQLVGASLSTTSFAKAARSTLRTLRARCAKDVGTLREGCAHAARMVCARCAQGMPRQVSNSLAARMLCASCARAARRMCARCVLAVRMLRARHGKTSFGKICMSRPSHAKAKPCQGHAMPTTPPHTTQGKATASCQRKARPRHANASQGNACQGHAQRKARQSKGNASQGNACQGHAQRKASQGMPNARQ